MRKMTLTLLTGVLALSLAACGNTGNPQASAGGDKGSSASGERTYFINPKSIGPAYWAAAEKGAKKAEADLKVKVLFNAPTEADSSKQINMIQDMLTRKVNGIGVSPNDAKAVGPVFKKAAGQDVKIVTWDSDAPDTDRQYYVAPATDKEVGELLAKTIGEEIGGKGQVAFMVAGLGSQNQIAKSDAAKAYFSAHYPDVKVVTTVSSDDDQQKAYANAQNLIKTYPDLKGIIGFAGGEPPAAAEVVEQAVKAGTLKKNQIAITGIAVPSVVKNYIKNGTIKTDIIWDPGKLAYVTVYALDQLAQGKEIKDGMDIPNVGAVKVDGPNIFIGTLEVTGSNVDSFDF
ncbi:autoinducer 2 ABC transporter substrate-binding protein [Paenibacillus doosanensis]|uniref:Autoinducer 2-binding protein LsrB n=1 Tax=Paenibacillus konkukensis TaxID=2020716 RepID=A0ABY4RTS0_9BACL|nr:MULTISPECIES: autoinducer 2 ABC transporter substrate-binding protein [Paenibacillus]MCS7464531.1 autoinducer 2 ABC transporter substrate-binding protein [Paenibacillus doosanensis]UQZ85463.1 Autoinducer 2-binding protein LsrB precursor [Paenibacillus konkukensis]